MLVLLLLSVGHVLTVIDFEKDIQATDAPIWIREKKRVLVRLDDIQSTRDSLVITNISRGSSEIYPN